MSKRQSDTAQAAISQDVYQKTAVRVSAVSIISNTVLFALKLLAVVLGAVIYYLVIQVVLWLGLNTDDLKLLTALVVALFLSIPHLKSKYFSKGARGHA